MPGPYLFNFGSDDEDRPPPYEEEQARIRPRYVQLLVDEAGLDEVTADLVIATLFDRKGRGERTCICSCHPHLSSMHDDGFDCSCSWTEERRAQHLSLLHDSFDSSEDREFEAREAAERASIERWIASDPGVIAEQTCTAAPEQWEGTVDGHSFYFRERHDLWSLEIDLEPTGRFAKRIVGTTDDGKFETVPESVDEGRVIAEGSSSQLPDGSLGHLQFIVRTIRDHLYAQSCAHTGALFYCPMCGTRMTEPV